MEVRMEDPVNQLIKLCVWLQIGDCICITLISSVLPKLVTMRNPLCYTTCAICLQPQHAYYPGCLLLMWFPTRTWLCFSPGPYPHPGHVSDWLQSLPAPSDMSPATHVVFLPDLNQRAESDKELLIPQTAGIGLVTMFPNQMWFCVPVLIVTSLRTSEKHSNNCNLVTKLSFY